MDIHSAAFIATTLIMKDLLHWQVLLKNADSLNTSSEYQVSKKYKNHFFEQLSSFEWVMCFFFHSLDENNIGKEGCIALSAALQECKELQSLRYEFITFISWSTVNVSFFRMCELIKTFVVIEPYTTTVGSQM